MKCIMPIFQPVQSTNKRATSTLMRAKGKILPNAGLFVFPCLFILFFRIVGSITQKMPNHCTNALEKPANLMEKKPQHKLISYLCNIKCNA